MNEYTPIFPRQSGIFVGYVSQGPAPEALSNRFPFTEYGYQLLQASGRPPFMSLSTNKTSNQALGVKVARRPGRSPLPPLTFIVY